MNYQDYEHFSHHHVLIYLVLDEGEEINCNGCKRLIYEPFHGCLSCNFYLHDDCLNTPRFLRHPSHPHSLTLLPTPTYASRSYSCDACGSSGDNAFSLCCAQCEFDLHVHCANLPTTVLLDRHPHDLKLHFGSPYEDKSTRFACDLCSGGMQPNYWLYYCADCDFATHLNCAMDKSKPNTAQSKTQETKEENEGELNQQTPQLEGDEIDGKSGRATALKAQQQSEEMVDDGENPLRKLRNDMLEHQLAVAQLQHQMNLSAAMASVIRYF